MAYLIHGGTTLTGDQGRARDWSDAPLAIAGEQLVLPGETQREARRFDAGGLLVLPGMVDLHGDAFERQIQPRPGTIFPHALALADTDRQLAGNGITTACHGLTYSWEGGLRGHDAAVALLDTVASLRARAQVDHRIHLRFENHHADGLADALAWIAEGRIDFLAFNDHLPSIAAKLTRPGQLAAYAERGRCSDDVFIARLQHAMRQADRTDATVASLAAACRARAIPMASHDDVGATDRLRYEALGVTICEFPKTDAALRTAVDLGNQVVMGAPNVLLGGSHCGGLSAAAAVAAGECTILASDYYYPSMLQAAFTLAAEGLCSLPQAWSLVSANPAKALGLDDRGCIEPGRRADLVLVDASDETNVRLAATFCGGRLVYCAQPQRLQGPDRLALAA